jgi:hypothetical protein
MRVGRGPRRDRSSTSPPKVGHSIADAGGALNPELQDERCLCESR